LRSRLSELGRVPRVALGALAFAWAASPASSLGQQTLLDSTGLRGDDSPALAMDAAPPVAAGAPSDFASPSPDLAPPSPDFAPPASDLAPPAPGLAAPTNKKPPSKTAAPALRLGVYPGAQRLGLRGGPPESADGQTPPPTIAALPTPPPRRKPAIDDKPFDPVGIEVGDMKLTPYVEEDVGWSSNPGLTAGEQKGSAFETTEGGFALQSDWSRSDLHGSFKGGYTDYFASPADNAPYGSGTLDGRLDVTRDLSLDAEGRFNISTQTLTSLGLTSTTATTSNPLVETYGGTIGGAQKLGLFTLGLHGTFDRTAYEDATLADGLLFPLSTDNYNDFGLKARASYELSPAISPFVEIDVDARRYDDGVDYAGFARNSNGVAGLAGASLAFSQQLSGEASFGYGERSYDDPRLPDMRSPLIDASLIWTATPLTTVTGKASTALADTVTPGASGSVERAYTIDVAHSLTRALTLGASAGYSSDDYVGVSLRDWTTTFGARAEYHLSRDVVLRASASRQQYESTAPNSNYVADIFLLGLRFQR
jgi:hypothetical protein